MPILQLRFEFFQSFIKLIPTNVSTLNRTYLCDFFLPATKHISKESLPLNCFVGYPFQNLEKNSTQIPPAWTFGNYSAFMMNSTFVTSLAKLRDFVPSTPFGILLSIPVSWMKPFMSMWLAWIPPVSVSVERLV